MDDETIKKFLVDELYWGTKIDASDIKARVDNGQVMLTGTVPNWYSSYQARRAAERTLGVRAVENDLVIRS